MDEYPDGPFFCNNPSHSDYDPECDVWLGGVILYENEPGRYWKYVSTELIQYDVNGTITDRFDWDCSRCGK